MANNNTEAFRVKLQEWKGWLSGSDIHSVNRQMVNLLWRSAFYRSVNESRRYLPADEGGRNQVNGPLHELIDEGYFILNAMAIRRLLDNERVPTSHSRGVYSLYGLARDIKDNAVLFSRMNVMEARGLEYEFEPIKRRAFEEASRTSSCLISGEGWREAEYWHLVMDKLSGVLEANRRPSDGPDPCKMEDLLQELDQHGCNVNDWVNKFVAHAASPDSRQTVPPDHLSISLANLWRTERVLVRVANFLALNFVIGSNLGGVPIPQFDQFAYLDRPFANPAGIDAMGDAWKRHNQEVHDCQWWFWDRPLLEASELQDESQGN